jgi:Zn-dependent protease
MEFPIEYLLFFFLIIVPSAIIHEYAHGWAADQLGDPTARHAGRLTLNPLAHIDMIGTIILPITLILLSSMQGSIFMFAYAKPVPFNPYNLKDRKKGPALVAIAGPAANFVAAVIFGILVRLLPAGPFTELLSIIVFANVLLMVFNLVPIPPLDGSKVLFAILPDSMENFRINLERYGMFILLFFIIFLFDLIIPVISGLYNLIVG